MNIFKRFFINSLIVFFSIIITLFILNLSLIYLIKQKNFLFEKFDTNRMSSLQNSLFPDIYNNFENEYTLLVGDSYTFGNGDSRLNGEYNYSIPHHMFSNNRNLNFFNAGRSGSDSFSAVKYVYYLYNLIDQSIFLKNSIKEPNKIIFFFYEGNDIMFNARSRYKKMNNCSFFNKKLNTTDKFFESNFYVLKFFYYNLRHQLNLNVQKGNLVSLLKIILSEKNYTKLENKYGTPDKINNYSNIILFNSNISKSVDFPQFPPFEITSDLLDQSYKILDLSLNCLNSKFPNVEKYFVYIPSPAVLYNFADDKILVQSDISDHKFFYKSVLEFKKESLMYEKIISKIAQKNSLKIISIRNKLLRYSKNELIHGIKDFHHFNSLGYKLTAEILLEEIY